MTDAPNTSQPGANKAGKNTRTSAIRKRLARYVSDMRVSFAGWCKTSVASFKQQGKLVFEYLREKFLDGISLAIPTAGMSLIPPLRSVATELTSLFMTLPFVITVIGVIAMLICTAFTERSAGTIARRAARAWFDLVQQFFVFGSVVAPVVRGAQWVNEHFGVPIPDFQAQHWLTAWIINFLLALVFGASWALRDENADALPLFVRLLAPCAVVIAVIAALCGNLAWGVENGIGQDDQVFFRALRHTCPDLAWKLESGDAFFTKQLTSTVCVIPSPRCRSDSIAIRREIENVQKNGRSFC
ncbi:hypothetical protein LJR034_005185 [Caballeronia sp. LjRoot34]|uniref:hypothetical protein n=1 Tax=Caballeronia sp. LjRoot34 TaxID=3342325 RepID=UPI003ECE7CF6